MDTDISISNATASDVPAIVELFQTLYNDDGRLRDPTLNPAWAASEGAGYFQGLISEPDCCCWLARQGGAAIGYLIARLHRASSFRLVDVAELESMVISPAWRRRGVGQRLVQQFRAWAQDRGASQLHVSAYAANTAALAFYESQGFAVHQVTLTLSLGE
jgi:ribosomal protein S18 acetylase RimI-like enzyme